MKKIVFVLFCVFWSVAQAVEMKSFLLDNYGWTINLGEQERGFFKFSWDLKCSDKKQVFPKDGVNVFMTPVCIQKDRSFWTVVLWRTQMVSPGAIEKNIYKAMSDGLGYGKVVCKEEIAPSSVSEKGVIRDCEVPLQHGTFYVSFYHFEIPMPNDVFFTDSEGKQEKTLGFTIWVQNAGNIDNGVKDKIRELVSAIEVKK